jgi:hypothetical protein
VAEVRVIAFLVEVQHIMAGLVVKHTPILAFKSRNVTDFSQLAAFAPAVATSKVASEAVSARNDDSISCLGQGATRGTTTSKIE